MSAREWKSAGIMALVILACVIVWAFSNYGFSAPPNEDLTNEDSRMPP